MRIFGIDPGSVRTGYGCVDTDDSRHRLVTCGAVAAPARATFPEKLQMIHHGLRRLLRSTAPDCVVVENLFHARNVRSDPKTGLTCARIRDQDHRAPPEQRYGERASVAQAVLPTAEQERAEARRDVHEQHEQDRVLGRRATAERAGHEDVEIASAP